MFGIILTIIGALLHLYVFWRTSSAQPVRTWLRPKTVAAVGLMSCAFFAIGRNLGHDQPGTAAHVLELVTMTWMGTLFLMAVCLAATEIITAGGLLFRKHAPALRGCALLAGVALSVFAFVQALRPPAVEPYQVEIADLPRELHGTRIAAVSDLHLSSACGKAWLEDRVRQIQDLHPDLIVLLGDIFEGHGQLDDQLIATLDKLSAPLGVWSVPGNHEHYGAPAGALPQTEHSNARPLLNRWVQLQPGLNLAGVEDLTVAARSRPGDRLVLQALMDRPPGATLLLSHTPWQAETAAALDANLMLSAHTHNGQIWPFCYLVQTHYPFVAGRYQVGNMTLLVCRGTGTWGPCLRLWKPGEIMLITLRAKP